MGPALAAPWSQIPAGRTEMAGKSRRHFDETDAKVLLEALEAARRVCVQAGCKAPIRGDAYIAAEKVIEAIDDAALVLTGRRDHLWLKSH